MVRRRDKHSARRRKERTKPGGSIKSHVVYHERFPSSTSNFAPPPPHLSDRVTFLLSPMAHSRLGIRSFVPTDLDEVRLTVTRSIMEPLAVANTRSTHLPVHLLSNSDDVAS